MEKNLEASEAREALKRFALGSEAPLVAVLGDRRLGSGSEDLTQHMFQKDFYTRCNVVCIHREMCTIRVYADL